MKAVVLERPGQLRFTDTASPDRPEPDTALVRIRRVGICGTDLHAYKGDQPFFEYPRILGHELGVEVVDVLHGAPRDALAVGDRCAVEPYLNCGRCGACRRGKPHCCDHLRVIGVHLDGGMREYMTVPVSKLHRSPTLSYDQLALVEMLCIGRHAVARAELASEEPVLVIGAGPIGLSVVQSAQLVGANVVVMEVHRHRARFCRDHLGIDALIDGTMDPLPQLRAVLRGDLPTTVFDATGNPRSMTAAFEYVAHGGKLVFVGFIQGDIAFRSSEFHRRETTLFGSRNATTADFVDIIRQLEAGVIDLTQWITHRASPAGIAEAFPDWLDPSNDVVKAMLEW